MEVYPQLTNMSDYEPFLTYDNFYSEACPDDGCEVDDEDVAMATYVLELVLMPLVGAVGVLGNILSIIVLYKSDQKETTFHHSLITLAVINMLFLIIIVATHFVDENSITYVLLFPHFMNPMKNITVNCDSFLIMAIALERLLAVWKPIRYRTGIVRKSKRVHALAFILPPILVSATINIPKFFETELYVDSTTNVWDFRVTDLREDPNYIYYYIHWFRNIITGIIPITFLIIVNAAIIFFLPSSCEKSKYKYKYTASTSTSNSLRSPSNSTNNSLKSPDSEHPLIDQDRSTKVLLKRKSFSIVRRQNSHSALTLTLTTIVIIYIVCNLPRLLLNVFEHLLQDDDENNFDNCGCEIEPKWFTIMCSVSHFLLTFNSSANFIIYWSTVSKFKKTLKNLFLC